MTPEQEKQLLQAIYDRLYDAITFQPTGTENPFNEKNTFIHFSTNAAVDVDSFKNPLTPANPQGDLKTTEAFARMVDQISPMSLVWENSSDSLSETYTNIVNSANALVEEDTTQKEKYQKAYDYLYLEKEEKDPFTDEIVKRRANSPDYDLYEENMADYIDAITAFRSAYTTYLDDLDSPDEEVSKRADRAYQAKAPLLENNIKRAYRKLISGNANYVKQALAILQTTINEGIRQALVSAQEAVAPDRKFSSSTGAGNWLFSYPSPANWTEEGNHSFTELKISGNSTKMHSKATEHSFNVSTNVNYGLWRVKASSEGKFEHASSSTDKDSIEITGQFAKVNIMRPWFMESIFKLQDWYTSLAPKGGISNGKIDDSNAANLLPMYPVSFIVAKDVSIKADFSHEDEEHIKKSVKAGTSVGWGPFSIGGNYGYGKTEDRFNSDYQEGAIRIPGMQLIAWVSRVIPFSAQMSQPTPQDQGVNDKVAKMS